MPARSSWFGVAQPPSTLVLSLSKGALRPGFRAAISIAGLRSCATQKTVWLRAFVFSWLPFVLVSGQGAANWPQFRGNARLTGVAAAAPPDTLRLKWTYEAGESIESSAAIVDGAVYVGSA